MRLSLPGLGFGQQLNLLLEVSHDFGVLLLEDVGGLLRLQMHLIDKLAQLSQLNITVAVQDELKERMGIRDLLSVISSLKSILPGSQHHPQPPQGART